MPVNAVLIGQFLGTLVGCISCAWCCQEMLAVAAVAAVLLW